MMERVESAVVIDIHKPLLSSALRNLDAVSDEPMASDNFTIFRVPTPVRERNKHLYKPQMVAIGPYSRRDEPSLRAMEWLKLRYLQVFRSHTGNRPIEDYLAEIQKWEPWARRCYFERVEVSTEKFVEMLLLDGCFIIEFLIKWSQGGTDSIFTLKCNKPIVRGDLLLLENQIPLVVLDKLYELVTFTMGPNIPSLMELLVNYLATKSVESPDEEIESSDKKLGGNHDPLPIVPGEAKDFDHLLHLYHHCYVTKPQTDPTGSTISGTIVKWLRPSRIFDLLLSCIRFKICRTDTKIKRFPRTIPSATKLLEAGVTIKKKEKKKENQNQNQKRLSSFLDVTFSDGVLEIPFLSVENSTLPRFSNLVAFEQCGGHNPKEPYMTSYAMFMNCLIDTKEDIAILHQRGILENKLASDEDLAVFFNQLSDWASLDYDHHYLAELFRKVGEYCDSDWPSWRAKLVRDYFSSPWAIISLIAAAVLLILTILQTVYSIYAYYHPRNPSLSSWELAASDFVA